MVTSITRKKFNIDPSNPYESLDIEGYVKDLAGKQANYEEAVDLMIRLGENKLYSLGLNTQQTLLINGITYAQSKFTPDMSINQKVELLKSMHLCCVRI